MVEYVTVRVAQGELRGKKTTTKSGGPLNSFQGIPYAKPPVGPLRFKAPQPADGWSGTRDALQEGSNSCQLHLITNQYVGEEDCLFINVYSPEIPAEKSDSKLPVMVWIHGGAFMQGSGDTDIFGPDYLVDAGVVLVTFNYRLGPLGFLNLSIKGAAGNVGLKDQVLAFRWVKENIANFGGDPNNVTIFGESAGAASVHFHQLSPMSKGLFHRAICQSGSTLNTWAMSRKAKQRAFQLGEAMGCKTESEQELLTFLMQAQPRDLIDTMEKVRKSEAKMNPGPMYLFLPTIEASLEGEEAFLSSEPHQLLAEGKFHQVPFLTGVNSHEGLLMIREVAENPKMIPIINEHFERATIPIDLRERKSAQSLKEIGDNIKKFYFEDKPVTQESLNGIVNLNTDAYFIAPVHTSLKFHANFSSQPLYLYKFSFDGLLNMFKKLLRASKFPGACHADDIFYLFRSSFADMDLEPSSPESKTIKRMVKLWANFARTGNPTPDDENDLAVKWSPFTLSDPAYLNIGKDLTMEKNLEKDRMELWEKIYKL